MKTISLSESCFLSKDFIFQNFYFEDLMIELEDGVVLMIGMHNVPNGSIVPAGYGLGESGLPRRLEIPNLQIDSNWHDEDGEPLIQDNMIANPASIDGRINLDEGVIVMLGNYNVPDGSIVRAGHALHEDGICRPLGEAEIELYQQE
jgi:hypothetical protein